MAKARITIEAPIENHGILDIKDAMQQVLDFFELLSAEEDNNAYVWNLTFAGMNSPFSAEAEAVSVNPNVDVTAISATRIKEATDYLTSISTGQMPERRLSKRRTECAKRILRRNIRGIGRTTASFGALTKHNVTVTPKLATIGLATVEDQEIARPTYLTSKRERVEIGSIEGTLEDVTTDYGQPAIHVTERKSGRKITCRIDQALVEQIATSADFSDVWAHRRVIVRGRITFGSGGEIVRMAAKDIKRVLPRDMTLRDVEDINFTGDLATREYLEKLREGDLG